MTAKIWEACVKIHAGCGGVCRWVEAVERPHVGYTGECLFCDTTNIAVEQMIPLEDFTERQLLRVSPTDTLAGLEWDEHDDWESNQARLREIVDDVVRRPYREAGSGGEPA